MHNAGKWIAPKKTYNCKAFLQYLCGIVSHNLYFGIQCLFLCPDTDMQMLTLTVIFTKIGWWFQCSMFAGSFYSMCTLLCMWLYLFAAVLFSASRFIDVISLMECSLMNVCFHSKWKISKWKIQMNCVVRPSVEI